MIGIKHCPCPSCTTIVEPGENFCGECGNALPNVSSDNTSIAGCWLFSDSPGTVTFKENGTLTFDFETTYMEEDLDFLFDKGKEIPKEIIDTLQNDEEVRGHWKQTGNRLLFDCNNATLYDVEIYGDRMIGTYHYVDEEINSKLHLKIILEREGVNLADEEMPDISALKDLNDGSYDALLYKGFKHFFLSNDDCDVLNEAKKIFAQAVKIDPERPGAFVGIGMCYYALDEYEAALPHIEQALTNDFGWDARYEHILFEYLPDGNEPEDLLEYVLNLETLVMVRATIHFHLGEIDLAERDIDGIFDNIPEEYTADKHLLRAEIFHERDEPENALLHVKKALAFDPDSPEAHYMHGQLLFENGDIDAAIKVFSRSIYLNPSNPGVLMARAKAFGSAKATKEMEEDINTIRKMIDNRYGDAELSEDLNELLRVLKRTVRAG